MLLKINWINDHSYTLKYLSGSGKTASKLPSFLRKNTFTYQIVKVTNDYYTFKGYKDRMSKHSVQTDTMWLRPKTSILNNNVLARN